MVERRENIKDLFIEEEMKDSYLSYAMSVIMSRALPDVRDGLKPSQRRILVAMNDLNLGPVPNSGNARKLPEIPQEIIIHTASRWFIPPLFVWRRILISGTPRRQRSGKLWLH